MSKLSEMDATIKELRDIAASINDIANWLTGAFSADTEPEADAAPAPTAKEPEPVLAFEDVRAILAIYSILASLNAENVVYYLICYTLLFIVIMTA